MSFLRTKFGKGSKGASIVEFALIAPLFLIIVFGIIDLGLYFSSAVVLNAGVQQAVELASKLDLTLSCPPSNATLTCVAYRDRRTKIINKAVSKALGAWFRPPGTPGVVELVGFRDDDGYNCASPPCSYPAILLRPGERMYNLVAGSYTEPQHPRIPYSGPIPALQNWPSVLAQYPVYVAARAIYKPMLPFLPQLMIRADAIGYASNVNQALPWAAPPAPTPTPGPVTPTPTPWVGPTPTPGPVTPTPSPSPTPPPYNCSICAQCCYCSGGVCTPNWAPGTCPFNCTSG